MEDRLKKLENDVEIYIEEMNELKLLLVHLKNEIIKVNSLL